MYSGNARVGLGGGLSIGYLIFEANPDNQKRVRKHLE